MLLLGDNGETDSSSGDLLLMSQQTKDNTPSNNTPTSNNSTIETIHKKVGGRPAKSRTSITSTNSLYQGAIIKPLKCPHCSKDFLSEKGLQYHVGKFFYFICFFILCVLFELFLVVWIY